MKRQLWERRARLIRALGRVRPTIVASPLLRLLSRRTIIEVDGLRLFIDPTSHLGRTIADKGRYEPDTVALFREHIRPRDTVLDIGANEGFFSALAAQLVGPEGMVIAVEPQIGLIDVIEINIALNGSGKARVLPNVVGEDNGAQARINLFPRGNTGASSLVRRYRFSFRKQATTVITPACALGDLPRADFVKVDVEGYEPEVARSFIGLFQRRAVGKLLIDYHNSILADRGISAVQTHDLILAHGLTAIAGSPDAGYTLYAAAS